MSEFCLEEFTLKWRLVLKEEKGREMVLFSMHDRHSRRDVTCKPAIYLTDGLVFKGPYTLAALRS